MKTTQILAASLLTVFLTACSNDHVARTVQAPAQTVLAKSAIRVHGDLVPSRLVAIAVPQTAAEPVLSASMPGMPKKAYTLERMAEVSTRRDFARVVTAADAPATGPITLPIDAPAGARVIVTSRSAHGSIPTVHLRDRSGVLLDKARDEHSEIVRGIRTPTRTTDKITKESGLVAGTGPIAGTSIGLDALTGAEPGFAPLTLPRRMLSIDIPASAGRVTLDIPAASLKDGIEIDVQQPNSPITLAGVPRELNYGFGDVAEVEYTLANGETKIDGATFTGSIVLPNGEHVSGLTFASEGNGRYVARVPLASADLKMIGVWQVHAKAVGMVNGVEFERDIQNGFGYSPAHAQMTTVHLPEVVRGKDGLVDEIKLDVELETLVDDRLGLMGTLVVKSPDGTERSIGSAQTSADMKIGASTMTLHFEAKDVALAQLSGPYFVRDLTLVSDLFAVTQHRLGRGLDLSVALAAAELRYPTSFTPAVDEMFTLGDLDRR